MEIKSDTSLRIKIGSILAISGLLFLYTISQPGGVGYVPRWITLTALIFVIVGYLLVLIVPRFRRKKDSEKISNMYLITYGQKIPVDLSKCDVTEYSTTTSTLIYKHNADNKIEMFCTQVLPYDKTFLLSKLHAKKDTVIYVDNKDRAKYFFDIDFVYE